MFLFVNFFSGNRKGLPLLLLEYTIASRRLTTKIIKKKTQHKLEASPLYAFLKSSHTKTRQFYQCCGSGLFTTVLFGKNL